MSIQGKKRKIPLREAIEAEAEAAQREEMGVDPEFDPDRDLGGSFSGPRAFSRDMRDKDQLVIDELLATLPKNQGYYLKLYKEVLPNQWELKEKIDQYDTWTDMEMEIADRVRAMTRKFGAKKWGSARYRIVVWRNGGIRERHKYPPIDIVVDAGDDVNNQDTLHTGRVDPVEAANEQLNSLGNMLSAVQNIMPKAVDPNVQFQAIVQAFTAGKAEKAQAEASGTQMMMTMMTAMMANMMETMKFVAGNRQTNEPKPFEDQMAKMMDILKGFGFGQPPQPKGVAEQLAEMKLLGFDPFKKEDTIEQVAKLKALTGSLVDILPGGQHVERPGFFEKLVDTLAPHVPKIFSDLKAMTDNAAMAHKLQALRAAQAPPQPVPVDDRPRTVYGQPVGPDPNRMGIQDAFRETPDMDPYSGFTTRPFPDPTGSDAGIEMFGSVPGASADDLREKFVGVKSGVKPPAQPVAEKPMAMSAPVNGNGHVNGAEPVLERAAPPGELPVMLKQLYGLIMENMTDAYGPLYETLLMDGNTAFMIKGIQAKQLDGQMLTDELVKTGFPQFASQTFKNKSRSYLDGFVAWVIEKTVAKIVSECDVCSAQHIFENAYEFEKSDRVCGAPAGGAETCTGMLEVKADETVPTEV